MKILSLKSVRKEYHTGSLTVPAVEDVSFDLNEGEFVVILGASGAGKTTLLNLLGGGWIRRRAAKSILTEKI